MKKPVFDTTRAVSWSMLSSWEYDPEQWYRRYVLGLKDTSHEMEFGSLVDRKLQEDESFLPHVPRYPFMQHEMRATLGGIDLVGIADGWDPNAKELADYKTGKKAWDQKRADETGQLTMYALLLHMTQGYRPEDIDFVIHWLPTHEKGDFSIGLIDEKHLVSIPTRRTTRQMLDFGRRIQAAHKAMQEYARRHE